MSMIVTTFENFINHYQLRIAIEIDMKGGAPDDVVAVQGILKIEIIFQKYITSFLCVFQRRVMNKRLTIMLYLILLKC